MAKTNNLTDFLTDLADGIRAKKGTTGAINPQDFRSEIESIETGTDTSDATATEDKVFLDETFYAGGQKKTGTFTIESEMSSQDGLISAIRTALQGKASGGGGASTPTQEKTVEITKNGTVEVIPDEGYALSKVTANVAVPIPDGYIVPRGTKSITENGTHGVREYENVSVEVPIPDGYIVPSGTLNVTENGTHDVTSYASVSVNVQSGGGESPTALLDALLTNTLTSIDSDVTSIVAYACRGLSKLKTVNLPNVTSIGTYAFYYCTSMTSINAPKTKTLGTYAFYNCGGLKSVNFPLATSIPQNCLYSCNGLKIADFGVASTINQAGLAYCSSLEALILRKSDGICKLATATNALQGSSIANGTGYVYVPKAFLSDDDATMDYRRATNWSNYATQFRAIEDYPEITGG